MVEVLEQHLGETPDRTPHELAVEVADLIDLFSARARESNKELFAVEALRRTLEEELGSIKAGIGRIELIASFSAGSSSAALISTLLPRR